MPRLRLALSLSGEQLIDLIDDRDLLGLLDRAPLRFTITGVERIRGSASEHVHGSASERTLEPTVAATLLAERAPRTAWLVAAAAHLDHPYNLARRVASLDRSTRRGRSASCGGAGRAMRSPPIAPAVSTPRPTVSCGSITGVCSTSTDR